MMLGAILASLAFFASATVYASETPAAACKVTFQVVYLDRLNNYETGIPASSKKDIDKRLAKYPDVCPAAGQEKGELVFFIHTSPATYHGTRVYTNTSSSAAAATDGTGGGAAAAASSTTTTAVPYAVDYSVFVLDVELQQPNDKFRVLHTFDQKGLYNTIYGIGYGKGKHPIPNVIEAAAKWVHESYLAKGSDTKW